MEAYTPGQVAEAITMLYSDPNHLRKAEANAWLTAVAETNAAWGVGLNLLEAGSVEVRYFCANMLLRKVHSEWSFASPDLRAEITAHLCAKLAAYMAAPGAPPVVVNRVCLVVAAIAERSPPHAAAAAGGLPGGEQGMTLNTSGLISNALQAAAAAPGGEVGEQTIAVVLALLQAIAEESEQLDRMRRTPVLVAMQARLGDVLAMLEACLSGHLAGGCCTGGGGRLSVPLLQLLQAWLKIDYAGVGRPLISIGRLHERHAGLVHFLLANLTADDLMAQESAVEILVDLLSVSSSAGGGGHGEGAGGVGEEEKEDRAVLAVLGAIHAQARQRAVSAPGVAAEFGGGDDEEIERSLCRVALTAVERAPHLVAGEPGAAGGGGQQSCDRVVAAEVAEFVLACAARGDRAVVETAVEFFMMLNTVPVAERRPEFQGPLYGRLLQVLLQKAAYPPGFTTWAAQADDHDSFHRFRDSVVGDGLDTCFNLLGAQYVDYIGHMLEGASQWQAAEVAVFAVRSVSQSVRARVLPDVHQPGAAGERDPAGRQKLAGFLGELFLRVARDPPGGIFSARPEAVESAARLLGSYAAWFAAHPEPLEGVLGFLLRALQVPTAMRQAAHAFRSVCARCTHQLKAENILERLIDAAEQSLAPVAGVLPPGGSGEGALSRAAALEDCTAVVEGLARVTAALPPASACAMSARLATPIVTRIQHLAGLGGDHSQPTEAHSATLGGQLNLLASVVRFLESSGDSRSKPPPSNPPGAVWPIDQLQVLHPQGSSPNAAAQPGEGQPPHHQKSPGGSAAQQHPCVAVMELAWPALAGILAARRWRADAQVMTALCAVYKRSLLSVKEQAIPMLPSLRPLVGVFEEHLHPSCLEVLGTALEVCSSSGSGGGSSSELFAHSLQAASAACFALLQRGQLADRPEVMGELFEMLHRYLLFAPALLLASPALPSLVQASAAVVQHQERDSTKAALTFVSRLLAPPAKALATPEWQQTRHCVDACLQQQGEGLAVALLRAAAGTLPRDLMRPLAGVLYSLLTQCPGTSSSWLVSALSRAGTAASPQGGGLGESEKRVFCEIALKQPPLPRPRFEAMVADFASICRREGTQDLLLAYQL